MDQLDNKNITTPLRDHNFFVVACGLAINAIMTIIALAINISSNSRFNDAYDTNSNVTDSLRSIKVSFNAWIWLENIILICIFFAALITLQKHLKDGKMITKSDQDFGPLILWMWVGFGVLAFGFMIYGVSFFVDKLILIGNDAVYINCIFTSMLIITVIIFVYSEYNRAKNEIQVGIISAPAQASNTHIEIGNTTNINIKKMYISPETTSEKPNETPVPIKLPRRHAKRRVFNPLDDDLI